MSSEPGLGALATLRVIGKEVDDALTLFVHDVVDAACGRDVDVTTRYTLRSGGAFVADLAAAVRRLVLLQASAPLPETELIASLKGQGLDHMSASLVARALSARMGDLRSLAGERSCEIAAGVLRDFDWSLRVILASSSASQMEEPRLILTLHLAGSEGAAEGRDTHVLELSRPAMEALVADVTRVDSVLHKFFAEESARDE